MARGVVQAVLKEKQPTISRIIMGVKQQVEHAGLRFPIELRWETGGRVNRGCEFNLSPTQKITIPDVWVALLMVWSRRVVDGLGALIDPTQEYHGYVFSHPGEPERFMSPRLIGWLLSGERDPVSALLASAEATLMGQSEFSIAWYATPVAPCVVQFLRWYKTSSTHPSPSIASYTSVTRGWLSRFGREAACTPTDPTLWSHCFARAGKHNMYKTAFLWDQEWRPWLQEEHSTSAPGMPGLPSEVLRAHEARPMPLEACWTAEQLADVPDDPHLATLLSWASADGRVQVKPRVTPYLPRFAGGDRPVSREKSQLLSEPWDFASEIEGIKKGGGWWARPQLLQYYPTTNKDFIERDQHTATISQGQVGTSSLTLEPYVHLQGTRFDDQEFMFLRVPVRIATLLQSYAVQLTSEPVESITKIPKSPDNTIFMYRDVEEKPAVTTFVPVQAFAVEPTDVDVEQPAEKTKGGRRKKKAEGKAVIGGGLESLAGTRAPPRPAVKSVPRASKGFTAEDALQGGWTRHHWLCVFRRLPDVPNPYDLKRRQRIGELGQDHPRFANGFLVPPDWLPLLSAFYHRLGHPSAHDRAEIPGLDAYLDVPWSGEGAEEWDAAVARLEDQPSTTSP
jgi:hypothetical protein